MRILESSIEYAVCRWADQRGLEYVKLNLQGRRGYPDRLFFIPGGRPFLLELKRPGAKPDKLQQYQIDRLRKKGYDVEWTDSKDQAVAWLKERIARAA